MAPTETGVVRDARAVYEWVASRYFSFNVITSTIDLDDSRYCDNYRTKGQLIVWGHSLGTAVSSHLVTIIRL